jgi:hypothetical protein
MNILFQPDVENYLFDLIELLFKKQYFSFYDNAENYVYDLINHIEQNIAFQKKSISPIWFKKYGTHYITYHPNKRTTWYIFFTVHGDHKDTFLIRFITNNHVSAQHIRGLR